MNTNDVFGTRSPYPLSYQVRSVETVFLDALLDRDTHVEIQGSSKQGKTCLRKHVLGPADYTLVSCQNDWRLPEVMLQVLRRSGYAVTSSSITVRKGKATSTDLHATAEMAIVSAAIDRTTSVDVGAEATVQATPLAIDPSSVGDVVAALDAARAPKWIVLEDFHYLPELAQQSLAFVLRAFLDESKYRFIVVGVWHGASRLTTFNGDLAGRVVPISVDDWDRESLMQVISNGERLLGIRFGDDFTESLIRHAFDSVFLVQEVCRRACLEAGVTNTKLNTVTVGTRSDARRLAQEVANEQSSRYLDFLAELTGTRPRPAGRRYVDVYKFLPRPLLTASTRLLEDGLPFRTVFESIRAGARASRNAAPPSAVRVSEALREIASLQNEIGVRPHILDYDSARQVLSVADRGFLVWLANQDRTDLLQTL